MKHRTFFFLEMILELKGMQFEKSVLNYTTLNLFQDTNSLFVLYFHHFTPKKLSISVQRGTEYHRRKAA